MSRTWRDWYAIRSSRDLAYALRKARVMAASDHPDTPTEAVHTVSVRETAVGWDVQLQGKPR